jgi:hypothetical protein
MLYLGKEVEIDYLGFFDACAGKPQGLIAGTALKCTTGSENFQELFKVILFFLELLADCKKMKGSNECGNLILLKGAKEAAADSDECAFKINSLHHIS